MEQFFQNAARSRVISRFIQGYSIVVLDAARFWGLVGSLLEQCQAILEFSLMDLDPAQRILNIDVTGRQLIGLLRSFQCQGVVGGKV